MAKGKNMLGKFRGKVGATVFRTEAGIGQIASEYNPNPKNPRTYLQTRQRTKMNLAGLISSITPKYAITGLNANARMARSEFVSTILNAAVITGDGTSASPFKASVAPDDIIFSKGSQALKASVSTAAATTGSEVTVGLTLSDSSLAGKYGERLVVAVVDPNDKGGYSMVLYKDIVFDNTTALTVTISFGAPIENGSMVCLYRCPYVLNEGAVSQRYQTLANDGNDIIAKLLEDSSSNNVRSWGLSSMAASLVFTQA